MTWLSVPAWFQPFLSFPSCCCFQHGLWGVTRTTSLGNPHLNAARQLENTAVSSFPQCSNNGALIDYDNTAGISYEEDSCVVRNGLVFRVKQTFVTNGKPNWAPYVEDNEGRIAVFWEWVGAVPTPPVTAVDITITAPSDQGMVERSDQDIVFSCGDGLGVVQSWIAISVNGNVVPVSCNVGRASATCLPAGPLPAGESTTIVTVTAPSGASDTEQVAYRVLDLPPEDLELSPRAGGDFWCDKGFEGVA
ncbi:MAG: hypothetical protein G3M70_08995 [Candidatus Nitronauta litoralis]|uniref:Uncharacterized protein n=1 Tax=Candidatus Nitronauta litoralis TaxID=2705533 RepID=A0A7T0BWX7_9BACT|nr:MAG: hypothetical protein G3M70_08995 [Candidatus Nitronauta litoralis]